MPPIAALVITLYIICFFVTCSCQQLTTKLPYPSFEFEFYKPLKQSYYAMVFGFDNEPSNICDFTFYSSCSDFFCNCTLNESVCSNLTMQITSNSTFRQDYFTRFNYCLYCNNSDTLLFQKQISTQNQCTSFPRYELIINSLNNHCNNFPVSDDSIMNVTSNLNIGMVEHRFFSDNNFYSSKYLTNNTASLEDNSLHFFHSTFLSEKENPVICFCFDQNEFGFQCDDAYKKFFIPFKFKASNMLLFAYCLILLFITTLIISIPHIFQKIKSINLLANEIINSSKESTFIPIIYLKCCFAEIFATDLTSQVILYLTATLISFSIENLLEFVWNFKIGYLNINSQLWGVFRAVGVFFSSLTYCVLLVQWSHLIYLVRNNISNRSKISKINLILYISLLIFNCLLVLIGVILSAIFKNSIYFFALSAITMIVFPAIFLFGFTVYGIIILKKLKRNNTNVYQLRFTKFILGLNIIMTLGIIVAIISAPSFIISWDLFGVFLGLNRNFIIDVIDLIAMTLVVYIIYKEKETSTFYAKVFGIQSSNRIEKTNSTLKIAEKKIPSVSSFVNNNSTLHSSVNNVGRETTTSPATNTVISQTTELKTVSADSV